MEEQASVDLTLPGGPYNDIIPTVPGLIEAEAFDHGGPEVAYHDTTPGNRGNVRYHTYKDPFTELATYINILGVV